MTKKRQLALIRTIVAEKREKVRLDAAFGRDDVDRKPAAIDPSSGPEGMTAADMAMSMTMDGGDIFGALEPEPGLGLGLGIGLGSNAVHPPHRNPAAP